MFSISSNKIDLAPTVLKNTAQLFQIINATAHLCQDKSLLHDLKATGLAVCSGAKLYKFLHHQHLLHGGSHNCA